MDSNILLSKIVSNSTPTTWAQVYSTINLYVVLSMKSASSSEASTEETPDEPEEDATDPKVKVSSTKSREAGEKSIAAAGKDLLERIQREYFSQDEKSLENIKKAIEQATIDVGDLSNISLVLANLTGEVLYLVVVSGGKVILRRNGKVATVAAGTPGQIEAYSGQIKADDVILLETSGFAQKITVDKLSETLDHLEVSEIAESLAPILHADSDGSEAAMILQYKKNGAANTAVESTSSLEDLSRPKIEEEKDSSLEEIAGEKEEPAWEKEAEKHTESEADDPISHLADNSYKPPAAAPVAGKSKSIFGNKKIIIIAIILTLVALFIGSIFFEKGRKEQAAQNQILNEILSPAQKKFDEATALISLNKGLALDEFTDLKNETESNKAKLPEGTDARKKLDEFISKVNTKIEELGAGATLTNQKVIFKNAAQVTFRDGQLAVIGHEGTVNLLDKNGKSTKEIDAKNKNPKAISGNQTDIFTAGDAGIADSPKKASSKIVVEDPGDIGALDTFGANLYALNTTDKTVDKYPTANFKKSTYFTEDITLNDPISMSIDGSIWVLDAGKVRKFTKGKEDSFAVSGLTKEIGANSQITTGIDYSNIYILDPTTTRILSISKSGEVKNQYVSKDLANATSIAVDEEGKLIYVVISGKLTSFDL